MSFRVLTYLSLLGALCFASFSQAQTCSSMKYLIGGYFPSFSPSGRWIGAQQNGQIWIHDLGTNGIPPAVINVGFYQQNMGDTDSRVAMGDTHSLFIRKDQRGDSYVMLAEHAGGNPRNVSTIYTLSSRPGSSNIQIHPPSIDSTGQIGAWAEQDRSNGDLTINVCKLSECKNKTFYTHTFSVGILDRSADINVMPAMTLGRPVVFVAWYKQRFGPAVVWAVNPSKSSSNSSEIELFTGNILNYSFSLIRPNGNNFQYIVVFDQTWGVSQKGIRYRVVDIPFQFVSSEQLFSFPNSPSKSTPNHVSANLSPFPAPTPSASYDWLPSVGAAASKGFIFYLRAWKNLTPSQNEVIMQTIGGKTIPITPRLPDIWGLTSSTKGTFAIWEPTGTYIGHCQ